MTDSIHDPDVSAWWLTSIIDMAPGRIEFRGTPIETLMGNISWTEMIWFMIFGRKISHSEKELFEVAMVMSVDHGPQAPSIAIARMAATCGVGMNSVMASAINVLGDHHGGAGEQCTELFYSIRDRINTGINITQAVELVLKEYQTIPGYGHRFHKPRDPRAPRALEIVRAVTQKAGNPAIFADIAEAVEQQVNQKGNIMLNVDGASAVIFCELGVPAPLARGLFCLSRSVGILAHAWEQIQQGGRNKGPVPKKYLPAYVEKDGAT